MNFKFILTFLLFLFCVEANATHIFGGTLGYTYLRKEGNKEIYNVVLELYSDCNAPFPGPSPMIVPAQVFVYNKNGTYTYKTLRYYSETEVSPLCPDEANNSSCRDPSSLLPGVYKYVYQNEFELEGTDENWVFSFYGIGTTGGLLAHYSALGLNAQTINWVGGAPVSSVLYLEARLNNTIGPNSSPQFTSPPVPFVCINKLSYYTPGAIDADLDELKFSLAPSWKVNSNVAGRHDSIQYYPSFSSVNPLPCDVGGFNFNETNGQLVFTPDNDSNSFVNMKISEYRNGVLVGTSMRQTTFIMMEDCNNDVVNTPISNIKNADFTADATGNIFLSGCEGLTDTMSFDVVALDPNNDNVTIDYTDLPAGASISIDGNGTQNAVLHFKWGLTEAIPATYFFYVTYRDDGCPISTFKTIGYTITIVPHNISFTLGTRGSCAAIPDGKAWVIPNGTDINYNYKWVDTATGIVFENNSSNDGDTLTNVPPGVYKVYARNNEGCGKNFILTIDTTPLPTLNHPNDSVICEGMPILIKNQSEIETQYLWNTGDTSSSLTIHNTGEYILTARNHCGALIDTVRYNYIKCNFCLFVPNAFSPNGDGTNDVLKITPTCLFQTYKIMVFNRFGQMVYDAYSLDNSWDGTFNGTPVTAGTYYYSIEAKYEDRSKGTLQLKGDVTVVR